jgi:hypothetical protein
MEQLKKLTFEEACKIEKIDPKKVKPDFSFLPVKERKAMVAISKIVIMVKAANRIANNGKAWKANHKNNEVKFEPRWYMGGSSGFRYRDCDGWHSRSLVGSRLCFKTYEAMTALTSNKHYVKLWNEWAV